MGTGNSSLDLFEVKDQVEYKNNCCDWQLNNGRTKKEPYTNVSIFKFNKKMNGDVADLAQRHIQKLRTLRYTFVLTYLEAGELEDSNIVVTECCMPLELWLKTKVELLENLSLAGDTAKRDGIIKELQQELVWGFRCILLGLNFLHSAGSLLHGNIGMHSIFVTPGGDWKVGSFELCSNLSQSEDLDYFMKYQYMLDESFMPPERKELDKTSLLAKLPPYYVDIYSLGKCIEKSYAALNITLPKNLVKYTSLMLHNDIKKRPTALKLSTCALFTSDQIKLLENIDELALKSSKEALAVISGLEPTVSSLSQSICSYKLLPNINRILQMAINDFPNRDSRESSRQSIQLSVMLLAKMAEVDKVDPEVFENTSVPLMVQLWAMADRSVRTCLLQSLKQLAPMTTAHTINRSIFDHLLSGFTDSNSKLRETTLTSLMNVVDKLDDHQLNDKLVRCIVTLQNDKEASIRTNSTIFLGKIAPKLNDVARIRVLCTCFAKAMKDTFLHCRIAGLKTANQNVHLLDFPQMVTKVIPQASLLALEKSADVRALAIALLDSCAVALRKNHETIVKNAPPPRSEKDAKDKDKDKVPEAAAGSSGDGDDKTWSSYLNKSIETATALPEQNGTSSLLESEGSKGSSGNDMKLLDPEEEVLLKPDSDGGAVDAASPLTAALADKSNTSSTENSISSKQAWTAELESLLLDDDDDMAVTSSRSRGKAAQKDKEKAGVQKLKSDNWEEF